jgi:VanZ family protein
MSEGFRNASKKGIILWTLWVLYIAAWSIALLTPHPVRVAEAVLPAGTQFLSAKTLHVAAYLVLTILTGSLGTRRAWRWVLLAFLSAHAMGTEYFQQFVPPREGSWRDVGLDHIGICLGVLLAWKWWFPTKNAVKASGSAGSKAEEMTMESTTPVADPSS